MEDRMSAVVNIEITISKAPVGYDSDHGDTDNITDLLACLSKFVHVDLSIRPVKESVMLHHGEIAEEQ
jgi:hypothetical protein